MRATRVGLLLALTLVGLPARGQQTLKVKMEGTELDNVMLLTKLNNHGADHGLKFAQADSDYDYRIVFATSQGKTQTLIWGSGGQMNTSQATVAVYDAKGTELFEFQRAGRATDSGTANATAKEIIKRILRLRKLNAARKP